MWDYYSESSDLKNQVILISSGTARVVSSSDFLVHARAHTGWFSIKASPESDYVVEVFSGSARIRAIKGSVAVSKPDGEQTTLEAGSEALAWQTKNTSVSAFNVEEELEAWRAKKQGKTSWLAYAGIILLACIAIAAYYFHAKKKKQEDAY